MSESPNLSIEGLCALSDVARQVTASCETEGVELLRESSLALPLHNAIMIDAGGLMRRASHDGAVWSALRHACR